MMKGRASIQLFNAETGEKEYETTEENLITKAVDRLINPPIETVITTEKYAGNALRWSFNQLVSAAYGGLLLFANSHEENLDNIYPTKDDELVGYASSATNVTTPKEGVRNEIETGFIDDDDGNHIGYKFVWDFSTSQANGTISSISLTSDGGGLCGMGEKNKFPILMQNSFRGDTIRNNPQGSAYLFPYTTSEPLMNGINSMIEYYGGSIQTSNVLYISPLRAGKFFVLISIGEKKEIKKIWFKDPKKLSILQNTKTDTFPPGYISNEEFIKINFDNTYYYNKYYKAYVDDDEIHVFSPDSNATEHKIYDLTSGVHKETRMVSFANVGRDATLAARAVGYLKDKNLYVAYFKQTCYWITADGEVINKKGMTYSGTNADTMTNLDGGFFKSHIDGYYYFNVSNSLYRVNEDDVSAEMAYLTALNSNYVHLDCRFVKNDYDPNANVISFQYYSSSSPTEFHSLIMYAPLNYYLGTINNLSSPVTKTEAHTMKVIYELTESEG